MTRITIIDGHPDPNGTRYVHALADAYAAGGEAAGHEVRRIEIAELDFPILRSAGEWRDNVPAAAIHKAQTDIRWAYHLVLLYPLFLRDVPFFSGLSVFFFLFHCLLVWETFSVLGFSFNLFSI